MNDVTSRITNVIETRQGDAISYFTLEGLLIGSFKGGTRVTPEVTPAQTIRPAGGVIKAPTPEQVRRNQDRDAAALQTTEGRLKHLKEDVA